MNSDIRVLTTFPRHPKTIKLKRILGTWEPIITLWLWAAENRPNGDLSGLEIDDIAIAAAWVGTSAELVDALEKVRFIERRDSDGAYILHGWKKHNAYAANAEKRSEKARLAAQARWDRRLNSCTEDAKECLEHAQSNAPSPSPTPNPSPNPTPSPNIKKPSAPPALAFKKEKIARLSNSEIQTATNEVVNHLIEKNIFKNVKNYVSRYNNQGISKKAILHALIKTAGKGVFEKSAFNYAKTIMESEDAFYNARDSEKSSNDHKEGLKSLGDIITLANKATKSVDDVLTPDKRQELLKAQAKKLRG